MTLAQRREVLEKVQDAIDALYDYRFQLGSRPIHVGEKGDPIRVELRPHVGVDVLFAMRDRIQDQLGAEELSRLGGPAMDPEADHG